VAGPALYQVNEATMRAGSITGLGAVDNVAVGSWASATRRAGSGPQPALEDIDSSRLLAHIGPLLGMHHHH